jgi:DNA-binding transcriptional MerR regulator/effector-binding domain-containing protein
MNRYFTVSELAKLAKINKRTLHYYDEIGLFSPSIIGENGYRYYSMRQGIDLGIILSLKELDMPLKEIKQVVTGALSLSKSILEQKLHDIDQKIAELEEIKQMISKKLTHFSLAEQALFTIQIHTLPSENLLLSGPIQTDDSTVLFNEAYKLLEKEGKYLFTNNEYGLMIDHQKKKEDQATEAYDYFYLKTHATHKNLFMKPAGKYLCYVYKGTESQISHAYKKIMDYCSDRMIQLDGYFYERALNETIQQNHEEYVTEIQVRIVE